MYITYNQMASYEFFKRNLPEFVFKQLGLEDISAYYDNKNKIFTKEIKDKLERDIKIIELIDKIGIITVQINQIINGYVNIKELEIASIKYPYLYKLDYFDEKFFNLDKKYFQNISFDELIYFIFKYNKEFSYKYILELYKKFIDSNKDYKLINKIDSLFFNLSQYSHVDEKFLFKLDNETINKLYKIIVNNSIAFYISDLIKNEEFNYDKFNLLVDNVDFYFKNKINENITISKYLDLIRYDIKREDILKNSDFIKDYLIFNYMSRDLFYFIINNKEFIKKFKPLEILNVYKFYKKGFTFEEIEEIKNNADINNPNVLERFSHIKDYKEDIIDILKTLKKFNTDLGFYYYNNDDYDYDNDRDDDNIINNIAQSLKRDKKGDNFKDKLKNYTTKLYVAILFINNFDKHNYNLYLQVAYKGSNNIEEFVNRLLKIGIYLQLLHNFSNINLVDNLLKVFRMKLDLSRNEVVKFAELACSLTEEDLEKFKTLSEKKPEKYLNIYNDLIKINQIFNQEKGKIDQALLNKAPELYTQLYIIKNNELIFELEEKAEKKNEKLNINIEVSDGYYFKNLGDNNYGHFTIGADTNCCQRLGGAGESAAKDSFVNPLADVLVLYNKDNKIISQSYFHYVPETSSIILDNVEVSTIGEKLVGPVLDNLYIELTDKLLEKGYKEVFCGKGFNNLTLNNSYSLKEDPRKFSEYGGYTDFKYEDFIYLNEFSNNEKYKIKEKTNVEPTEYSNEYSNEDYYENQIDKKYNMKKSLLQLSNIFLKFALSFDT